MRITPDRFSPPRADGRPRSTVFPRTRPRFALVTLFLMALVLIGLALRLWFVAVNDIDPRFSAADDGDYYQRALRFAATGSYTDDSWLIRPPLHVLMFAGLLHLSMLLGDPALGIPLIRVVHIVLSLLMIPLGYDLARRLFGMRSGLIFAAILAVWFPMVELPALILSEPLFFYFLLIHLWTLVRWRDSLEIPGGRSPAWLFAAGLTIGLAALARSPALYASVFSLAFIALTLVVSGRYNPSSVYRPPSLLAAIRRQWRHILLAGLVFAAAFVLAVGPWTLRNYIVYKRFIPVDTLGPVNLWLALSSVESDLQGEGVGKSILAGIPQAERQDFVSAEIRRIISENPVLLVHNFWPHFIHIWKAQFLEDFVVKVSFFTRPLRDIWPVGAVGDLIWLVFTSAACVAITAPLREGAFRLVGLGWMGYSALTVMLLHVEPRYLLPIWLMTALYGAAALAWLWEWLILRRSDPATARAQRRAFLRSPAGLLGLTLFVAFLYIFFTYRNYPAIISAGVDRERLRAVGMAAFERGDLATAERELQTMVDRHPTFVDGRVDLARVLMEQGRYDDAWIALGSRHTHRSDVIRGAITRAQGKNEQAVAYFTDAEFRAGEDVQQLSLEWLSPAPTNRLLFGDGLDFGYLQGFSFGEVLPRPDGSSFSYRWMRDEGRIELPLLEPLHTGSVLRLRMVGGGTGVTPLQIHFANGQSITVNVVGGEWRVYRVQVPEALTGRNRLSLHLVAPTFIPAQRTPGSGDARLLSVAVSDLVVD